MTMTPMQPTPRPIAPAIVPWHEQRVRALELEADLEERLATRSARFRCGTALFNDDFPRAGALNVLRVDSGVPPLEPEALMQFADELQAGLPQRSLRVVDDERANELRPSFAAAGWVVGAVALMTPRRRPDRPVDVSSVRAIELDELREARAATLRREHRDLASAEQLLVANTLPADGFELRSYAATVGCEVAAYAVARVCGDVAKLTELDAFSRAQGQGLGRAVIWGAVTRLRAEGARLVFVEAEDDTWPKWTFRRLGFEDIGHAHRFVRPWGDESAAPPAL
jgi:GNAT superfamily N-acetyltransferase